MEGPELIQILTGYDNRLADMETRLAELEQRVQRQAVAPRQIREDWHRLAHYWRTLAARVGRLEEKR
jgi:hypothetical protein